MNSFFKLPQELIVRTASHLTTPELGSLRRTCKHIEACLFDSFAREFFRKRQFMIEEVSLQALVDIANHKTLSPYLNEVIISTHSFYHQDPRIKGLLQRMDNAPHDLLVQTGRAREMLSEAFSKLANFRIIGMRDYNALGRYREGAEATWESYGHTHALVRDEKKLVAPVSPDTILPMVLYALGKANARPKSLELFFRHSAPLSFEFFPSFMEPAVGPVLSGLETLMLTVGRTPQDQDRCIEDPLFYLKRTIAQAQDLTMLRINFTGGRRDSAQLLEWLGASSPIIWKSPSGRNIDVSPPLLSKLKKLDLGMAKISPPQILGLVSKFTNLTSLSLWRLTLEDQSATYDDEDLVWTRFLRALANQPNGSRFTRMMIGFVSETVGSHRMRDGIIFTNDQISDMNLYSHNGELHCGENTIFFESDLGVTVCDWLESAASRAVNINKLKALGLSSNAAYEETDSGDGEEDESGSDESS